MAAGIRSSNLPLGALVEVLGNRADGSLSRAPLDALADALRGIVTSDPSGVAGLRADLIALTERVAAGSDPRDDIIALTNSLTQLGRDVQLVANGAASAAESIGGLSRGLSAVGADVSRAFDRIALEEAATAALDAAKASRTELSAVAASIVAQRYDHTESPTRPGEGGLSFTFVSDPSALSGANRDMPVFPASLIAIGDDGPVARVLGSGIVGSRRSYAVEPGRVYRARGVVRRRGNASDPSNDGVRLAAAWLDQARNVLPGGITVIQDINDLLASDGRQEMFTTFARSGGDGILLVAPANARHVRLYVQTFGPDGLTDVEVLEVADVTDLTLPAVVTTDALARIGTLESGAFGSRIGVLEAANQNPNSVTYATRGDAAAASVPASVTTIVTRGLSTAGDGLGASYKRIGSSAGSDFRSADGAYWQRTYDLASAPGSGAVSRRILDRLFDRVTVLDYLGGDASAALAAAAAAAGAYGTVHVAESYSPGGSVGSSDRTWFRQGAGTLGSADRLLGAVIDIGAAVPTRAYRTAGSTAGGFFADYDCNGHFRVLRRQGEDQTGIPGGGFRDAAFFNHLDTDERVYTTIGQKVSYAVRGLVTGSFGPQTKDLVGGDFHAIGRITGWDDRGVSGVTSGAIQYGSGIASNEFAVQNPADANEQSTSMAAAQAILRSHKAPYDPTHRAIGLLVQSDQSWLTNSAIGVFSSLHPSIAGRDGAFERVIDLYESRAKTAAIRFGFDRAGSEGAGTRMEYDPNDWTDFLRATDTFRWVIGGGVAMSLEPLGLNLNGLNVAGNLLVGTKCDFAQLYLGASTAAKAQIRFGGGVAPTAPESGDLWFDGTDLMLRIGSTTRALAGPVNPNYDAGSNTYRWSLNNAVGMELDTVGLNLLGLNVGSTFLAGGKFGPAHLYVGASTTTKASLRIGPGVAPTAPDVGDLWFDGTALRINIGGTVKTFVLQ